MVQRVVFLHEDLMKLPSFPRKALEAELDLYVNGEMGKVSLSKDTRILGWPTFKKVYNSILNFGADLLDSCHRKALDAELDLYVNREMGKVSLSKDPKRKG